jgi:hypothetical protein
LKLPVHNFGLWNENLNKLILKYEVSQEILTLDWFELGSVGLGWAVLGWAGLG